MCSAGDCIDLAAAQRYAPVWLHYSVYNALDMSSGRDSTMYIRLSLRDANAPAVVCKHECCSWIRSMSGVLCVGNKAAPHCEHFAQASNLAAEAPGQSVPKCCSCVQPKLQPVHVDVTLCWMSVFPWVRGGKLRDGGLSSRNPENIHIHPINVYNQCFVGTWSSCYHVCTCPLQHPAAVQQTYACLTIKATA